MFKKKENACRGKFGREKGMMMKREERRAERAQAEGPTKRPAQRFSARAFLLAGAAHGLPRAAPREGDLFGSGVLTSDAAGDQDLGNGVAAQAVAGEEAAGDLASRVQAFDDGTVFGQHVAVKVDHQAAMVWWVEGAR